MGQFPTRGWVLVSPGVLSFSTQTTARWAHCRHRLIVAVLAGLWLWFMHQTPQRAAPKNRLRDEDAGWGFRPGPLPQRLGLSPALGIRRHYQERVQETSVQGSASR